MAQSGERESTYPPSTWTRGPARLGAGIWAATPRRESPHAGAGCDTSAAAGRVPSRTRFRCAQRACRRRWRDSTRRRPRKWSAPCASASSSAASSEWRRPDWWCTPRYTASCCHSRRSRGTRWSCCAPRTSGWCPFRESRAGASSWCSGSWVRNRRGATYHSIGTVNDGNSNWIWDSTLNAFLVAITIPPRVFHNQMRKAGTHHM